MVSSDTCSSGDRRFAFPLMRAAVACGIDGLFFEAHPDPEDRNRVALNMFRAWYVPLYYYGVIHGDPHLGNYTVFEDAGVASGINLLDYGCIRIFPAKFVGGVVDLYNGLRRGDDALGPAVLAELAAKNPSAPPFLGAIRPQVVVMNNGPRKGTMPKVVATLRATKSIAAIYQVHENVRPEPDTNTAKELIANAGDKAEQCAVTVEAPRPA